MRPLAFNRDHQFCYGSAEKVAPGVRRITAENPGPYTFYGTGSYILGEGEVAVIDPGPEMPEHHQALCDAISRERVTHLVVTHCHLDHAGLARRFAHSCGQKILGFVHGDDWSKPLGAESAASNYRPDQGLRDGDLLEGADYRLRVLHTPGHTSDHLCLVDETNGNLYCGDHIMAWSSTVILPPDGNMGQYIKNLERLKRFDDYTFWPTHGPCITRPSQWISQLLNHRQEREEQLVGTLKKGPASPLGLVTKLYPDLDPRLHGAASQSIFAGLLYLRERELVSCGAREPARDSAFVWCG